MAQATAERPLPVTARGQRTRQRILDAAEEVFGERGYHQAGIVDITQKADVALGTFYVYFGDKRAAFQDLVRELNHRLRMEIQVAVSREEDRLEKEVVGFETFFTFVRRHRNLYKLVRQTETVDPQLLRWHYATLERGYVRGLRAAQRAGQIDPTLDPVALAYLLMGMAEALGMRWVLWEERLPPVSVRQTFRALLLGGIRPAGRTRA